VLVLDEPTNDLDLETLELLESRLVEFPGTLLLVSHDRAFLDNTVTSTLVFEGAGRVQEYAGGYEDWLRQRPPAAQPAVPRSRNSEVNAPRSDVKKKLSYNEQREFEQLPGRIGELEAEQELLNKNIIHADFYKEPAQQIQWTLARLDQIHGELLNLYKIWDDLDSRSK
jgi:ATP-binding cassette subfamily F protein uup